MSERDITQDRTGPEKRTQDGRVSSLFLQDDSLVVYDTEEPHAWIRAREGAVELPTVEPED